MTEKIGTVQMDHFTTLFYKGVGAGMDITKAHANTEFPDHDTRVRAFLFYGGAMAVSEAGCTTPEEFGQFMAGLATRVPVDPAEQEDVRFTLTIASSNDAVVEDPASEIGKALVKVANKLNNGYVGDGLLDSNGNTIGSWKFEGDL